ncbi:MAG: hypothetical protein ACR2F2_02145 [Pyrinomonadaceae bacterium]
MKKIFGNENYRRIWRNPSEENKDIYTGLVVQDNRVGGSITIRQSRLPLWTLIGTAIREDWESVQESWNVADYDYSAEELADFLYHLLELRGEFARLILELANAHRQNDLWWIDEEICEKVRFQMQKCLVSLSENKE